MFCRARTSTHDVAAVAKGARSRFRQRATRSPEPTRSRPSHWRSHAQVAGELAKQVALGQYGSSRLLSNP